MDEAERLCDRVAIVDQGRVIALGSPADLIAQAGRRAHRRVRPLRRRLGCRWIPTRRFRRTGDRAGGAGRGGRLRPDRRRPPTGPSPRLLDSPRRPPDRPAGPADDPPGQPGRRLRRPDRPPISARRRAEPGPRLGLRSAGPITTPLRIEPFPPSRNLGRMSHYHPLRGLYLSRLREFYRQPARLFWVYGFPTVLALGLGLAFQGRSPRAYPGRPRRERGLRADPRKPSKITTRRPGSEKRQGVRLRVVRRGRGGPSAQDRQDPSGGRRVSASGPVTYRYDPTRPEATTARAAVDAILQAAGGRVDPIADRGLGSSPSRARGTSTS